MKLLCIDGNSIMNRAYYGIKVLTNSKGISTNAITGFMNIYLKEIAEVKPDCVAVAFDLRSPTFRHLANSAYKANRKGMPDDLAQQMPLIRKLLKLLGIKTVECEGFEADDILGTLSRAAADSGNECFILTGDRDSFQLINDKVTVRLAGTKETKIYTPQRIRDEYGVEPLQMIEVKALMGDTSDNISGVRGIGEKTALSLIQQTGSVDGLYDSIDELTLTKSVRSKLECGRQDALDSRFLATIRLDVPIEKSMEAYKLQRPDSEAAREMLTELEMLRLMERLGLSDTKMANTDQETKVKLKDLPKYELDLTLNDEVILTMTEGKKAAFIFDGASIQVFFEDKLYKLAQGDWDFDGVVLRFFESGCEKITFEGKRAHKFAFDNDTHLNGLTFCCDLAGYLLNSQAGEYTVENLSLTYKVIYRADLEEYADVATLPALAENLRTQLETTDMMHLYNDIELPLCEVLASMEHYGVRADTDGIREFGEGLKKEIGTITAKIYELAGEEFNIASTKQLGEVLFEKLGLPVIKKTKSGYSTNAEVLDELSDKHPIVPLILDYRTLTKLNSTYVDGLLKEVEADGRVHSVFKQTETDGDQNRAHIFHRAKYAEYPRAQGDRQEYAKILHCGRGLYSA